MKKRFALLLALMLGLSVLTGCSGGGDDANDEGDGQQQKMGSAEYFSAAEWLDDPNNEMMFTGIAVNVYPDVWDKKAGVIDTVMADEDEQAYILDKLDGVIFNVAEPWETIHSDFAFAMNEPFLFFEFSDKGLLAQVPNDTGYDYFEALTDDYPQLNDLYMFVETVRIAYFNK